MLVYTSVMFFTGVAVQAIKARKKRSKAKNRHKNVENRYDCCTDAAVVFQKSVVT